MGEPILVAKEIRKSFGRLQVLKGLDITINKGDRYILFGSNGAGKTTLVRILSTLMPPDSGEIKLFGKKVEGSPKELKAKIGFMSHDPYLYPELSAWENLEFFSSLYSIKNRSSRIKTLLVETGLLHRSYDRMGSFSRGMKQRLALARTLLHDPDLIFLDEAYSGLDIRAQNILNERILRLNKKGKTFIFITHNIHKGFEIANRGAILSNGLIVHEAEGASEAEFSEKLNEIIWGESG
ncbi:MAG: ABC transporter ATP-binding protein [Candidatus Thermoplasmatota archaeon]|jgi:ABC-type multidrug transport system ATPase subunit|nr:ABC transporter ATP-binding protein [Candidatus Thermoplasmatota archaeon]MDP7265268.1 ABC transporter ATP-binding protein [Candidatus Thermoplasmatota archaeon]